LARGGSIGGAGSRVSEGDIPGEAAGLGETGRLRRGGAGERQELGETDRSPAVVESGER
jgi:hypothetical protein